MIQVKFINEKNEVFKMDYSKVNDFCKSICLNPNYIEEFNKFKVSYSVFEPYFDFVVFKLQYIFCVGDYTLGYYPSNSYLADFLYDAMINGSEDYQEIKNTIKEAMNLHLEDFPVIRMAKCSDKDLNIQKIENVTKTSFLIDKNAFGYISNIAYDYGSHVVTANTILNQSLIKKEETLKNLMNYINEIGCITDGTGLNYLIAYQGYLRITEHALIYNGIAINEFQKKFIEDAKKADLIVEDLDFDLSNENQRTIR